MPAKKASPTASPKIRPRTEETGGDAQSNAPVNIILPGARLSSSLFANRQQQDETDTIKSAAAKGVRFNNKNNNESATAVIAGFLTVAGKNSITNESDEESSVRLLPQIHPLSSFPLPQQTTNDKNENNGEKQQQQQSSSISSLELAPQPGSTVLFRVTKVHTIGVSGPIVAINNKWCMMTSGGGGSSSFKGFVRLDDIRSVTAKEVAAGLVPTHAADSYRLGDLVCADVISLTEARQFQLTTTPPHCGLVRCFSERKLDGAFRYADMKRRDAGVIVVDEQTGAEKVVSRWVPDFRTTKQFTESM